LKLKNPQKPKNAENEKDARREMTAIRLINSSSTSVRNSNMKKTHDYKICGYLWIINGHSIDIYGLSMIYQQILTVFCLFYFLGGGRGCV